MIVFLVVTVIFVSCPCSHLAGCHLAAVVLALHLWPFLLVMLAVLMMWSSLFFGCRSCPGTCCCLHLWSLMQSLLLGHSCWLRLWLAAIAAVAFVVFIIVVAALVAIFVVALAAIFVVVLVAIFVVALAVIFMVALAIFNKYFEITKESCGACT